MITLKLAREGNYETVALRLPATADEASEAFAMRASTTHYISEKTVDLRHLL